MNPKDPKELLIGFIGQGWIGKNYADNFEQRGFNIVRFSKNRFAHNEEAIKKCDIVFIAVPTPSTPEGFNFDALRDALKYIGNKKIAIIKSTLLPGTTEILQAEFPNIYVIHSPEFLTEATAAYDAANPTRNIMGIPVETEEFREKARLTIATLPYAPYQLVCSSKEAEMIKYGGNNWFYFKVVFMNMLYDLSKKLGTKWEVIRDGMAADPRIGRTHLDPVHKNGRGAGGHCFIKDFAALTEIYNKMVGDELGANLLESMKYKNIDLLVSSNKDLDLLAGVYGENVITNRPQNKINIQEEEKTRIRCLVTGGAGFIGSNLVDELIERDIDVMVLDNLSSGKMENVNPKAKFHNVDIRNLEEIKPLFKNVDYVFHLAAYPRVQLSIENPQLANDINLNGTLNVLIAARDAKVRKVVYSASSSAYGDQDIMPLRENMKPNPMSPYALQKYTGEEYCKIFSMAYGLPTVCLRYFNVYGKRQAIEGAYALVIGIFINQRLNNQPMTIVGDGEQKRDFTSVVDVVKANILAANSQKVGKGEVINVGNGRNYSVNDVANFIGGPKINIASRIEPRETLADNSLARELLGWEPTGNLPLWIEQFKKEIGL